MPLQFVSCFQSTFIILEKIFVVTVWDPTWSYKTEGNGQTVLGRPREAKVGLKCQRLVHLGGPHQYQVLWPLKRPLRPSRGPQKGLFWPQEALWGPPNFLPRI